MEDKPTSEVVQFPAFRAAIVSVEPTPKPDVVPAPAIVHVDGKPPLADVIIPKTSDQHPNRPAETASVLAPHPGPKPEAGSKDDPTGAKFVEWVRKDMAHKESKH